MADPFFSEFTDATRTFQYDYILIDAIFLTVWVLILIKKKKWAALQAGAIIGIIIYFIDAVWWWNSPAGPNYAIGTFIREYWVDGVQMPHPLGEYFLLKTGADFMMTFSYAVFAFGWLWIMFENIEKKDRKEILFYTLIYFGFWMLTPILSLLIPFDNAIVHTVRHMDTQIIIWIVNVFVGYTLLFIIYGTEKFGRKNLKIIGYIFAIGCTESFFMEFPLFISGIRPTNVSFLIYEIFFLFNQGAPYIFIFWDLVMPWLSGKLRND